MHTITRPFMLIGGIALFIVILLGDAAAGSNFATTMTVAVIDIAKAILSAIVDGVFGSGGTVDPSAVTPPAGA